MTRDSARRRSMPVWGVWVILLFAGPVLAEAPQVKKLVPENGATNVDPGLREMRIVFDRNMSTGSFSICGGGDTFPEVQGQPKWVDARTLTVKIRLKPNHEYKMSLNCQSAKGFKAKDGTPLKPLPWSFKTGDETEKKSKRKRSKRKSRSPQVIEMIPEDGAKDVNPGLREMRVVFDRDMSTGSFSICGGGETFPDIKGQPKWVDARTLVMKIRLKPNHEYVMSLNCPSAKGLKAKNETPLKPVPWSFKTGEKKDEPKKKSKKKRSKKKSATPEIVELVPEDGATDVDPTLEELRVVFDRAMQTSGHSICGGGPEFPEIVGRGTWENPKTLVLRVRLEPDHFYRLSVNCPAAMNCRSKDGTPVEPTEWTFSTAPDEKSKLGKEAQRALNRKCFKDLMTSVKDHYSYYKLRNINWAELEEKHRKDIEQAQNTRAWIQAAAKMLSAAKDMHIWLKYNGSTIPTFKRKIKRNYSVEGIKKALPGFQQRNDCVFTARTKDNIGYIAITTLSNARGEELGQVPGFIEEFKSCKGLILDLRPNSGGAEPLAMPIASWFIDGEKVYAQHVTRDPEAEGGFAPPYKRTITGNEAPDRYTGPVAVLMGPGIMSSCEAFVLMMKQGEDVKLIGLSTYGSSGNPQVYNLDNGVQVFLPSWKAMRPDGTCFEGEGIRPDITVKAKKSAYKRGDPVIERALEYLRERTEK